MRSFNRFYLVVIICLLLLIAGANFVLLFYTKDTAGRTYRVEINRLEKEIEQGGMEIEIDDIDLSGYTCVTNIACDSDGSKAFYENPNSDYAIRMINGRLYRFDYTYLPKEGQTDTMVMVNGILITMSLLIIAVMAYIRKKILMPFETLCEVPYELAKGNMAIPIKEYKNRFFGKFVWGIDVLRENIEQQKQRELNLQRDKKTLILSISHDIKTPLSAIKLYAKALSKRLYADTDKQIEVAENINAKADEIEEFVSQIIKASTRDFLNLEVTRSEFYLSELADHLYAYYSEKSSLNKIGFTVGEYSDCILKGDIDRSIEVIQNILENAIKYGDGHMIEITFSTEEDCQLVQVKNSGCVLQEWELPHIFESFWRGSNSGSNSGSGLGLYICRQLMHKMDGEIFADIQGEFMCITTVFRKVG